MPQRHGYNLHNVGRSSVLLKGGLLSYIEEGKGPPVILIHGAGGRAEIWRDLFPILSPHFSLYALDLPGHGSSSHRGCERIEDYSDVVLEFIEASGLQGVALVGHSMGGAIAIKAVPRSVRVKALVLVGTGPVLEVNPKLLKALEEDFQEGVKMIVRWAFAREAPTELRQEAEEMFHQAGQRVVLQDMRACHLYNGWEELPRISVPTLVVCGGQDVMTPPGLSQQLKEGIAGARLVLIEGAGHVLQREKGRELAETIKAFLQEALSRG